MNAKADLSRARSARALMSTGPPLSMRILPETQRTLRMESNSNLSGLCEVCVQFVLPDYNTRMISNAEVRAETIGSLLRPPYLASARGQLERGELTPAAFKKIEDRAVDQAVALQEAAGLDVITDGEMRRYAFFGHLVEALEGFDKISGWSITFHDSEGHQAELQRPVVTDKLRWRRQMAVEEFT